MKGAGLSRHDGGRWPIVALTILVVASLAVLHHLDRPGKRSPAAESRRAGGFAPKAGSRTGRSAPAPQPRSGHPADEGEDWVPATEARGRVAIVIDDVGFEEEPPLELARLGLPLTFAILPYQRYSRSLGEKLRAAGQEVILHLPMEPLAYPRRDPGQGAVAEGMAPAAIEAAVRRDLLAVPEAVGVNNHMGSRATADPAVMRAVLRVVRERSLYFLDSRTTGDTVAFDIAREMGVPAVERSVFLDDRRDESYIEGQVRELLRKARERGSAVAIGHPDPVTVEVLKRSVDLIRSAEIQVVPASELAGGGGGSS